MGGKFFLAVIAILPTLTCSVFGQGRSSLAEAMFSDSEKSSDGGPTISVVEFVDTDILDVFKIISDATGWSIFASKSAKAKVSLWVKDITALELLDRAVSAAGLVYHRDKKLITVMSMDEYAAAFGLEKTIVSLKHAAAPDVASTIAAFLTAEGKLSVQESANRIAVLDTTAAMAEIARLVSILDVPSSMAQVEIVELCHRKAIELVPLLNAYFHASESARTSPVTSGTQHQQPSAASVSTGTPRVLSAPFAFHADEQTNHLVLVGIAADRQLVKDVIEKMDVPSAAEVRTYPVHNVDAREIFDALEEFFRRDSEGRESLEPADRLRVALGEQTNSITVYGASSDHIKAEALIESMDIPIPEGPGRIKVYRLENTSADSVAQLLIDLIGSEQAEASDAERPSGLGVAGVESAAAPPAGGPTREPSPASPGLEPETLEGAGISQVQRPRVAVAPEANAVVVWATPTDQQTLASLIEQIDERRAQVLIEAILLELTGDDDLAIGVELESLQPGTYRDTGTLFFTTFGLSTVDPATGLRAPLGAPGMSTAIIRPAEVPFILHAL